MRKFLIALLAFGFGCTKSNNIHEGLIIQKCDCKEEIKKIKDNFCNITGETEIRYATGKVKIVDLPDLQGLPLPDGGTEKLFNFAGARDALRQTETVLDNIEARNIQAINSRRKQAKEEEVKKQSSDTGIVDAGQPVKGIDGGVKK